jgi:uncharacterized protein with GYD domain
MKSHCFDPYYCYIANDETKNKNLVLGNAYYTMGQHDFVVTVELPNDESAMSVLLALGVKGNARTTTLKAFSLSEAEKVVSKLS